MARIPQEEVAEVRRRADIADIIGRYIPVQKQGRDYKAVCPFHDDHDPSLHINEQMQIYKCFVCQAGGNVFTFVQNYENVSFPEAVETVAGLIGFPLSVRAESAAVQEDETTARYRRILDETIRFTRYELNSDEAAQAKKYLEDRGLDETIREKFSIGYNPGDNRLTRFLKAKGYPDSDLVAVNVARTGAGGISDVFSRRITFPIHDKAGKPVGFSARTLDPQNPSKYVNTTDTVLFHKGELVYNANRAALSARREGKLYVCEGVTDVIAFARAGIDNAVCTLGTACTETQIDILKGLSPRIVFCYDGDKAGQNATMKAGRLARSRGAIVTVVDNPTGLDPDELIRKEGADALKRMTGHELSWMEFVFRYLKARTNFDSYIERREFVTRAQAEINTLTDEIDRRYFTEELSRISGFHIDYVPRSPQFSSRPSAARVPGGEESAEEQILAMMMGHKEASQHFSEKLGFLQDDTRGAVAMLIVDSYRSADTIEPSDLIDRAESQEERNLISKLTGMWVYRMPYDEAALDGAIRKVNISIKNAQAKAFRDQLSVPMNIEAERIMMEEYRQCLNDLRRYINEENDQKH
jgi:DNA primase